MDIIASINILDLFVNLKGFLSNIITEYHSWVYLILFLIVFCETGLVVTPFLPGDSLLFAAGTFAVVGAGGTSPLELKLLLPILYLAPICGDSVNYWMGRYVGPKIFHKEKVRFLNREHLDKAHAFYDKHGGKAVAIGRFLPIIRTFVPFVAGIGKMPYGRFVKFSVAGTLAWITACIMAGYLLGKVEFVNKHFEMVVIFIIIVTLLPAVITFVRGKLASRKAPAQDPQAAKAQSAGAAEAKQEAQETCRK